MTGKPESKLEKILRPIRIAPHALMLGLIGGGISLASNILGGSELLTTVPISISGGICAGWYFIGTIHYFEHKKIIKRHGFDTRYGNTNIEKYCNRQPLYVAAVKFGFRDEAKKLIEITPNKEKAYSFMPHI